MKVLQINAVYKKMSTGRTTAEMHEYFLANEIESYIASPDLCGLDKNAFKISNKLDMKVHGFMSRLFGLQGYFSKIETHKLLKYINSIKPDIIHLRNLHSNYINIKMLLRYIAKKEIATVVTLHDCWFYTGKCCHYLEDNCEKWKAICGNCPALKKHNNSWVFDRSKKMQNDKLNLFSKINRLGVVGVSDWVTEEAKQSAILKKASLFERIYNWIDFDVFKPVNTDLRKKLDLENKFIILSVAALWSGSKGISDIIEISEKLDDDCRIVLVGKTAEDFQCPDNVIAVGTTDSVEELVEYYSMADCCISCSLQETFGKTIAEALACGTPAVVYNSTALPELVGEGCGYVIKPADIDEMASKINLIKEQGKSQFSSSCIEYAEKNFNMVDNIESYISFYKGLLKINRGIKNED